MINNDDIWFDGSQTHVMNWWYGHYKYWQLCVMTAVLVNGVMERHKYMQTDNWGLWERGWCIQFHTDRELSNRIRRTQSFINLMKKNAISGFLSTRSFVNLHRVLGKSSLGRCQDQWSHRLYSSGFEGPLMEDRNHGLLETLKADSKETDSGNSLKLNRTLPGAFLLATPDMSRRQSTDDSHAANK